MSHQSDWRPASGPRILSAIPRDGREMAHPLPYLPPVLRRRYAVERELGRGGMGTVYLAHDQKHGRSVAIKVLSPDLVGALGPERFLREIGIVARLSHPHILPLHDSGQVGGLLFYVMPFIEGESLRQRLDRPPALPVAQALAIARELADALAYAHAQGVVHRDVKPANILLHEGHALLGDFGVARAQGDDPITASGRPLGTAAYASPEQAAGSRLVDQRSDVYGLGCVLYEMLAGPEVDVRALLERRFAEPLPHLGRLRPEVPSWVEACLERALAPHPDRRCTAAALRDALGGAPAGGRGDNRTPAPARRVSGRRRLIWMASGAVGLALLGAALAFLPWPGQELDPRRVVVTGFDNRTGDSTRAPIGDIAADYIARGLAETRLLHEVYDLRAAGRESGDARRAGPGPGMDLGKQVGAGTVLWGSYYRDGDSLRFEGELVEASSGRVILSLAPAVGPLDDPVRAVETLRQRVMGAFAAVFQGDGFEWKAGSVPPTYEAYQEMLAGGTAAWRFEPLEAAGHYRRALALDSSYLGAKTALALALEEAGDCRGTDSIAAVLEPLRSRLPPADLGTLDWATAQCRGDMDGAVEASRAVLAAAPTSVGARITGAVMALEAFRPHEALRFLQPLAARRHELTGTPAAMYPDLLTKAYHMAGDYRRQLREGAGATALAALGRIDAVRALLTDTLLRSTESEADPQGALCLALEVRAHGHPSEALEMVRRVSAWYEAHADLDPVPDAEGACLWLLLSARYYTGDSVGARAEYERVLARDTSNVEAWAGLGALAARSGDLAAVRRIDGWLATRADTRGMAAYGRARIAAIQHDRDHAVTLLTEAFAQGLRGRFSVHLDPDFEAMREYPPYQAITRLRDER